MLHHAVCREHNLFLVRAILEKNIELAFIEDRNGRTPLHTVSQVYHYHDIIKTLTEAMKAHNPDFFTTFDPQRKVDRSLYDIKLEVEAQETITLKDIVDKINNGLIRNILVLTGAGISTNAGIPDFRGTKGIYSNQELKEKLNVSVQNTFTLSSFASQPEVFYKVTKEIFYPVIKGNHKPTLAHYFIAHLAEKGLLLRNYTQNIDTLEIRAGVPEDKIIEAHGSFRTASCPRCSLKLDTSSPTCYFWTQINNDQLPFCTQCPAILKPDVVLFGEGLSAKFFDSQKQDLALADLVIVIGTSLKVYPFAGLPNQVRSTVPRLLFNEEAVGIFELGLTQQVKNDELITISEGKSKRDIAITGDIDKGIEYFIQLLNWKLK